MAAQKINISIVTPERVAYQSEADAVFVPTLSGEIGILAHHVPLIAALVPGQIRVSKDGVDHLMAVGGGVVEVRRGSMAVILAETAERAEEIDIERAEAARIRAAELMSKKQFASDVEFSALQSSLQRSLARIRVARRKKK